MGNGGKAQRTVAWIHVSAQVHRVTKLNNRLLRNRFDKRVAKVRKGASCLSGDLPVTSTAVLASVDFGREPGCGAAPC